MIPQSELEAWRQLAQWTIAAAGLFQWLAECDKREQDDANVVKCHDWVIDQASNATNVGVIEAVTGHNIRDQHSVGAMQTLHEEVELARMRGSRN